MSIAFQWDPRDFAHLVDSCERDDATRYILTYMPREGLVVEAGCGLARYVEFLHRKGFRVLGIELDADTIDTVKKLAPHLDVRQGDLLAMDFADGSLAGIICLGVVEHFMEGPARPLRELHRVLKPGAHAVITVPSFNLLRRIRYYLGIVNPLRIAKRSRFVRRIFGKGPLQGPVRSGCTYHPGTVPYRRRHGLPSEGFFEYLFSRGEFEGELDRAGFIRVKSVPIGHMDGIHHDISKRMAPFRDWAFYPNRAARLLNRILGMIPFCHNHMHLCVVRK
ncbi:MAG: class I SAM-dependent methyltransferase [bacterium]